MMRPAIALLLTIGLCSAGAGQAPSAGQALANGDVPRALYIQLMDKEFASFDTNRDGLVTLPELEAGQRATAAANTAAALRSTFGQLDTDRNGQLSLAEFLKMPTPQAAVNARPMMAALDANGDGKVGLVEYRTAKLSHFDNIDTDKDGTATVTEMKAAGVIK